MIYRMDDLSTELILIQNDWKHTYEILKVEDLLGYARTKEDVITDKDFRRKMESLEYEIDYVRWGLKKLLKYMTY